MPPRPIRTEYIDTRVLTAYLSARMKNKILGAAVVIATVAILASLLNISPFKDLPIIATILRCVAIALIAAHATARRSQAAEPTPDPRGGAV